MEIVVMLLFALFMCAMLCLSIYMVLPYLFDTDSICKGRNCGHPIQGHGPLCWKQIQIGSGTYAFMSSCLCMADVGQQRRDEFWSRYLLRRNI